MLKNGDGAAKSQNRIKNKTMISKIPDNIQNTVKEYFWLIICNL